MRPHALVLATITALSLTACGPQLAQREQAARPAVQALQAGDFDAARGRADQSLDSDADNPYALLVRAVVRYKKTAQQLSLDARTVVIQGLDRGEINQRYLDTTLQAAEAELAEVDRDLARVARHRDLAVELCLACWDIDWNGNGRVDRRDRLLMQIEVDEQGREIAEDDPRRKPTFRFDHGDVLWARAFVGFQRAALDVAMAYDWSAAGRAFAGRRRDRPPVVTIKLAHPERVAQAKRLIEASLELSDEARKAFLAETDDDREWVPSPRQKSHPMPLPVDDRLYETWEAVLTDVRRLVRGEETLRFDEIAGLFDERWPGGPGATLDIGKMLDHPRDIVVDIEAVDRGDDEQGRSAGVDRLLKGVLGAGYGQGGKPSPLPSRLKRMQREIAKGEEPLERKLRYLFWLN